MKHDRYDRKEELFFKNLASSYSERSGDELKKEMAGLDLSGRSPHAGSLDKKVKIKIRAVKIKKWAPRLAPAAACIILFIIINTTFFNLPDAPSDSSDSNSADAANAAESESPSATLTFEFVSSRLPPEYVLSKTDYDYQKVIYYIIGDDGSEIILTIEEFTENINTEGLERIAINDRSAYGISKEEFSFIKFTKDNFLYMLTSPDDYSGLIKISENFI